MSKINLTEKVKEVVKKKGVKKSNAYQCMVPSATAYLDSRVVLLEEINVSGAEKNGVKLRSAA